MPSIQNKPVNSAQFPTEPLAFCRWVAIKYLPGRLAILLAITVLSTASMTTTPWVVGQLIDRLPEAISTHAYNQVSGWFMLLILVWLVGPILGRFYTFVNAFTMPKLAGYVGTLLFDYTLKHPTQFFQNTFTGALTQRIRRASQSTPDLIEYFVLQFAQVAIGILVAGFWIFQSVPIYGFAYIGFTIIFFAASMVMAKRILHVGRALGSARAKVTGQLADSVGAVDLVHSFGAHAHESARLQKRIDHEVLRGKEARIWFSIMRITQLTLTAGFMSILVWFALQRAIAGELSIGSVVMLLTIGLQLAMTITNLGDYLLDFYMKLGEIKESLDVIAIPLSNQDAVQSTPLSIEKGVITFTNINFAYNGLAPIFNDLSLTIQAGERVGLVGSSGAGKSTLFKLLTRRYPLTSGHISIDDQDIATHQRNSIATQVAEVTQTSEMFHRSVLENIRYGRQNATDEEVMTAAKYAQCDEFIQCLPNGYQTLVGERGIKLSGGERQRIAIARAMLKDAPILLLDEATSSLDSKSEAAIQVALEKLMQGRTVIAIAHRLSTIVSMDRILYMEQGQVIESGTHQQLLAQNGGYAQLWLHQVAGYEHTTETSQEFQRLLKTGCNKTALPLNEEQT